MGANNLQFDDLIKTYLTPDEYKQIKLIDLTLELKGTTDVPERAAEGIIFRVEQNTINYLCKNYDFTESKIMTNDHTLRMWKLAICEQVEEYLGKGMSVFTSEGTIKELPSLCESAKGFLKRGGMLNMRRM